MQSEKFRGASALPNQNSEHSLLWPSQPSTGAARGPCFPGPSLLPGRDLASFPAAPQARLESRGPGLKGTRPIASGLRWTTHPPTHPVCPAQGSPPLPTSSTEAVSSVTSRGAQETNQPLIAHPQPACADSGPRCSPEHPGTPLSPSRVCGLPSGFTYENSRQRAVQLTTGCPATSEAFLGSYDLW